VEDKIEHTTSEAIQDWLSSSFQKKELALVLLGPVEPGTLDVSRYL
jgi:hypothetical protein